MVGCIRFNLRLQLIILKIFLSLFLHLFWQGHGLFCFNTKSILLPHRLLVEGCQCSFDLNFFIKATTLMWSEGMKDSCNILLRKYKNVGISIPGFNPIELFSNLASFRFSTCSLTSSFWLLSHEIYFKLTKVSLGCLLSQI